VSWLRCQKIAGLEYWVKLLFNFTPVSVRQMLTGPYQFWVRGRTGHAPRAHLKRTLHHEPRVKSEELFIEKYRFPEKYLSFEKISAQFLAKKLCTQVLNHSRLLASISTSKNYDG